MIPEDIQNKRLYDFESTDAFIAYYERATREGLARFEKTHTQAMAVVRQIPAHRRRFFAANLLVHIEIMQGLYGWVNALCRAAANRRTGESDAAYAQIVAEGVSALEKAIVDRRKAEYGRFDNWYVCDRLINLPELRQMTTELCIL